MTMRGGDELTNLLERQQHRLVEQATLVGRLQAETEALRRQLEELQQQMRRGTDDVARVQAATQAAADEWTRERERLLARITELEKAPSARPAPSTSAAELGPTPVTAAATEVQLTPTDLAGRFALVLQKLAEGPASDPSVPYSAALTGLEVEARGTLQPPATPDQEPTFLSAAGVDPGQLSTMRMTFKLLPRIPSPSSTAPTSAPAPQPPKA